MYGASWGVTHLWQCHPDSKGRMGLWTHHSRLSPRKKCQDVNHPYMGHGAQIRENTFPKLLLLPHLTHNSQRAPRSFKAWPGSGSKILSSGKSIMSESWNIQSVAKLLELYRFTKSEGWSNMVCHVPSEDKHPPTERSRDLSDWNKESHLGRLRLYSQSATWASDGTSRACSPRQRTGVCHACFVLNIHPISFLGCD